MEIKTIDNWQRIKEREEHFDKKEVIKTRTENQKRQSMKDRGFKTGGKGKETRQSIKGGAFESY